MTKPVDSQKLAITLRSEFLEDYRPGTLVSPDNGIEVGRVDGESCLFSIGTDSKLYLITKKSGTSSGWADYCITDGFLKEQEKVTLISVAMDVDGDHCILGMTVVDSKDNSSRVYHCTEFGVDEDVSKLVALNQKRFVPRASFVKGTAVQQMCAGNGKNGDVLLCATLEKDSKVSSFVLGKDVKDPVAEIPFAVNSKKILQTKIGHLQNQEFLDGVDAILYILYESSEGQNQLIIGSLPDWRIYNHVVECVDPKAETFGLINSGDDRGSTLFIPNSQGSIFLYNPIVTQLDAQHQVKVKEDRIEIQNVSPNKTSIKQLDLNYQNGLFELYALDEVGHLMNTRQYKDNEATSDIRKENNGWQIPFVIQTDIGRMTSFQKNETDELYLITLDDKLKYFIDGGLDSVYHMVDIALPNTKAVVKQPSFSVRMSFAGEALFDGLDLTVTADSLILIEHNGSHHYIDHQNGYAFQPDATGSARITFFATEVHVPLLMISSSKFSTPIQIDLKQRVQKQVESMSVDDLKNATIERDGKNVPLIGKDKHHLIEPAHKVIQEMMKLSTQKQGTSPPPTDVHVDADENTHVRYGSKSFADIDTSLLPDNYEVTANFDNSTTQLKGFSLGHIVSDTGKGFMSVIHGIEKVVKFTIKMTLKGLEMVFELEGKIFSFLLKGLSALWKGLNWVLKKVLGVNFDDLLRWLAKLLGWDKIIRAQKAIEHIINLGFDEMSHFAERAQKAADPIFNSLKGKIDKALNLKDVPSFSKKHKDSLGGELGNAATWMLDKVLGALTGGGGEGSLYEIGNELISAIIEFAENEIGDVVNEMKAMIEDIVSAVKHGSVIDVLKAIIGRILDIIIDSGRNATDLAMKLIKVSIEVLKKVLNLQIPIPFIGALYEFLLGQKLTLLNVLSLVIACATVVIKGNFFSESRLKKVLSAKKMSDLFSGGKKNDIMKKVSTVNEPVKSSVHPVLLSETSDDDDDEAAGIVSLIFGGIGTSFCVSIYAFCDISSARGRNLSSWKAGLAGVGWICSSIPYFIALYKKDSIHDLEHFLTWYQLVFVGIACVGTCQINDRGKAALGALRSFCGLANFVMVIVLATELEESGDTISQCVQNCSRSLTHMIGGFPQTLKNIYVAIGDGILYATFVVINLVRHSLKFDALVF